MAKGWERLGGAGPGEEGWAATVGWRGKEGMERAALAVLAEDLYPQPCPHWAQAGLRVCA